MYYSALVLGLMGSIHCLGMCGPLIAAMPIVGRSPMATAIQSLLYHFSRILGYGVLGLLPGVLSEGLHFTGLQKWLSLLVGVFFIIMAIAQFSKGREIHFAPAINLSQYVQNLFAPWIESRGPGKLVALGFLNGFIPCGMTYMALASALTMDGLGQSIAFMWIFGTGTIPALWAFSMFQYFNLTLWKKRLRFLIPIGYLLVGILMLHRAINTNIPLNLKALQIMGWDTLCH